MKKFLSLALALVMVLGLVACGSGGSTSTPSGTTSTPAGTTSTPGGTTPSTSDPSKPVKDTVNLALDVAVASSDPHPRRGCRPPAVAVLVFQRFGCWRMVAQMQGTFSSSQISTD